MRVPSFRIADIATVTAGQSAPQGAGWFSEKGTPFIRAGSLEFLCKGEPETACEKIDSDAAARLNLRLFPKDTIVFAKSGMSAKLGRIYRLKVPSFLVSHLAAIIPGSDVLPGYLHRWIERNPPARLIPNEAYPSIRLSEIENLRVPLPPLSKQMLIVATLDKADIMRRKRRHMTKLTDEFLRSLFLDMFGDPASNPKKFPLARVDELLSTVRAGIRTGPFGASLKKYEYQNMGIPVWGIESIENGRFTGHTSLYISTAKFEQLSAYDVQDGDILISRAGTVGRMCVARPVVPKSIIGTNLIRVVLDTTEIFPDVFVELFVRFPTRVDALRMNQKGNSYSFLNPRVLKDVIIPVPPVKLQQKYVSLRERVTRVNKCLGESYTAQDDLFNSIAQRAFRGEM
ncbi:MAG: hypothetical protein CVU64_01005 [Deltaproteobacteria bacterium HGW-Deltaproteobacteria-21]|nr:MAG: hypothetical protein CVU64_01005 [Deltaproteobacteria bacterium HGW-Deltaproteobacteria-21]